MNGPASARETIVLASRTVAEPKDVFHMLFADQDVSISSAPQRLKDRLKKDVPPSWVKRVEVYRLPGSLYFYNGTAIELSQEWGIEVPTRLETGTMTRVEVFALPVTAFIKWPRSA
jgi:hypothetical protein